MSILAPLALVALIFSQEAEAMVIVQDGQPRAVIVTAADGPPLGWTPRDLRRRA